MTETERDAGPYIKHDESHDAAHGGHEKRSGADRVRLDKWLWAARFYKTRAVAAEAIHGGHVQINGARAKPSRTVNLGDQITVRKGVYEYAVSVCGLSGRRGPASVVGQLYEETADSRENRERIALERRQTGTGAPEHRPEKRARRQIVRFMRRPG